MRLVAIGGLLALSTGCVIVVHDERVVGGDGAPEHYPGGIEGEEQAAPPGELVLDELMLPPASDPRGWRWRDDLRAFGGTLRTETGAMAGQTITLGEPFGADVEASWRDVYDQSGRFLGTPRRLWDGEQPIDVVATESEAGATHLVAWSGEEILLETEQGGVLATSVDGWIDADSLYAVTCGGGRLTWSRMALDQRSGHSFSTDSDAEACVLLVAGEQHTVVYALPDGTIWRARVGDDGFTDALRIGEDVFPEAMVAASRGSQSWLAIVDAGDVLVLGADGTGALIGDGRARLPLAIDVDGEGGIAVAHGDDAGRTHVVVGTLEDGLDDLVFETDAPLEAVSVGLTTTEAAASAWDGATFTLARVRR